MTENSNSPHRLSHREHWLHGQVKLHTLGSGDVFIRHGNPCMVVDLSNLVRLQYDHQADAAEAVWICDLHTGSVWPTKGSEEVYPAVEVMLDLCSTRSQ